MRSVSLLLVLAGLVRADITSSLGSALSMGTGFLPPELRGIAGTAANMALAQANKKKGVMEFVMDGSDYPYICLCPTANQIAQLKKQGITAAPDKCPEDSTMGCRAPQMNMDNAPLPTVVIKTPKK